MVNKPNCFALQLIFLHSFSLQISIVFEEKRKKERITTSVCVYVCVFSIRFNDTQSKATCPNVTRSVKAIVTLKMSSVLRAFFRSIYIPKS